MLKFFLVVLFGCGISAHAKEIICPFCDPSILEAQTFYQDELIRVLYTHKPIFPGHCLIIPKRHIERFEMLTEEESLHIYRAIQKVDCAVAQVYQTSSYLLLQKNGVEVGQSVPHVHVHYIPRQEGDDSTIKFIMRMLLPQDPLSAEEMKENVDRLQAAM